MSSNVSASIVRSKKKKTFELQEVYVVTGKKYMLSYNNYLKPLMALGTEMPILVLLQVLNDPAMTQIIAAM